MAKNTSQVELHAESVLPLSRDLVEHTSVENTSQSATLLTSKSTGLLRCLKARSASK